MSLLDRLDGALDWVVDRGEEVSGRTRGAVTGVGKVLTAPAGLALDVAKWAVTSDNDFSISKGNARAARDLLIGDNTLTGWAITETGEKLDWAYQRAVDNPLDAGITFAQRNLMGDAVSWGEAWEAAKSRNLGGGVMLALNETAQLVGDVTGIGGERVMDIANMALPQFGGLTQWADRAGVGSEEAAEIDSASTEAWKEFNEISPFWSGSAATAIDFGAMWFADPFVVAAKATTGARAINRIADGVGREEIAAKQNAAQRQLAKFLPGNSSRTWDKRIDELVGTTKGEATGVIDDDGVEIFKAVTDRAGWLDGKSPSEIYAGLRLEDLPASQGQTLASVLARTNDITDAAARTNLRRDIIMATNGDVQAMKRIGQADYATANTLSKAMQARGTGSVDAMFHDLALADDITAGRAMRADESPEVIASITDEIMNDPSVRDAVFASMKERTLRVSSAGERALARERGQGLGRDGTLHTGVRSLDESFESARGFFGGLATGTRKVGDDAPLTDRALRDSEATRLADEADAGLAAGKPRQMDSTTILGLSTTLPVTVVRKIGYYGTVGVPAKIGTKLSDTLRGKQTVSGVLPVEDSHAGIVYSVMRDRFRRAGIAADDARGFMDELTRAKNPSERALTVQKIEGFIAAKVGERFGVTGKAAEMLGMRIRRNQEMAATVWSGQRYSAVRVNLFDDGPLRQPNPEAGTGLDVAGDTGGLAQRETPGPDSHFADHVTDYDADGAIVISKDAAPIFSTQTPNHIMLHDVGHMTRWLRADRILGPASRVSKRLMDAETDPASLAAQAREMGLSPTTAAVRDLAVWMENGLEKFNGTWKRSVLGLRPISYLIRNTIEEQLRIAATGQMGVSLQQAAKQGAFDARKWMKFWKNPHVQYEEIAERMTMRHVLADEAALYREHLDDPATMARIDDILDEINRARKSGDKEQMEFLRSLPELQLWRDMKSKADAADVKVAQFDEWFETNARSDSMPTEIPGFEGVSFRGAFEGQQGSINSTKLLGSSQLDYETMGIADRTYGALRGMDGDGLIHPPPVNLGFDDVAGRRYFKNWHWVLNKQIGQAPEAKIALRSKADGDDVETTVEKVAAFLRSPEGKRIREMNPTRVKRGGRKFSMKEDEAIEDWAWDITRTIDSYVPTPALAEALHKGPIDEAGLKRDFWGRSDLPMIHRAGVDALMSSGGRFYERVMGHVLRKADEFGPQMWSRHPMFAVHYADEQVRLANRFMELKVAREGEGAKFTSEDLDELQRRASAYAHKQVQESFYDATTRSSAAQAMKFLYPFFAAHQDSMRFWSKQFARNPASLRRLQQGFSLPAHLGLVVDYEGNPVPPGSYPESDHYLLVQVPQAWGGPDPQDPESPQLGWKIGMGSLNLIAQSGSIINPGAGPLAAMPAGWIQANIGASNEDVSKMMKWFNPFGAPVGASDADASVWQALPTPVRRAMELVDEGRMRDASYYGYRLQEAQIKFYQENGRPPNKVEANELIERVGREVKAGTLLRVVGAVMSPTQPTPNSKVAGLLQEYRRLAEKGRTENLGPYWAQDTFLNEYGDEFLTLTQSSSEMRINNLGQSYGTVGALKANNKLVNKVDVRTWGLIVGPEDDGEFATDARRWLERKKIAPGSDKTAIGSRDPQSSVFDVGVAAGWRKYNQMDDLLTMIASQHGYPSFRQSPELMDMRSNMLIELKEEFPQWAEDFGAVVQDYESTILDSLEAITNDRKLMSDPARVDLPAVQQYVEARRAVQALLIQRRAAGGSNSMDAQENGDIAFAFTTFLEELRQSNIMFNDHAFIGLIEKDPYYLPEILEVANG